MRNSKNRKLVIASMLGAITIALGLTPLGFIPLGLINATTMHIPVIVAGILEGPIVGMAVGLIFGLSSIFNAITRPTPVSVVFLNPLISVLPRILIGLVSYYVYNSIRLVGKDKSKKISIGLWVLIISMLLYLLYKNIVTDAKTLTIVLSVILLIVAIGMLFLTKNYKGDLSVMCGALMGSMTNTILVLGGIYIIYAQKYMDIIGRPVAEAKTAILGLIITSGVPEAIISVVITTSVVRAMTLSRGK